jgi:hypothetical protein
MQIITQKAGIRPGGLALQDKNKHSVNRRPIVSFSVSIWQYLPFVSYET